MEPDPAAVIWLSTAAQVYPPELMNATLTRLIVDASLPNLLTTHATAVPSFFTTAWE